ncbi:aspartate aminotransferase family protein [Caloramator sp. E03]|uniref:aspartate aminotransferase family protein n=1 Tax=Caloramator sp. E03 TaxID=2576307 RepID=UPI001110731B|nr:aspartate aminotransferase family protein [Caloramator sp. E03]QCX34434.1 aspartate aminotransferase family protein [Caloramator sp. E03]
MSECHIMNTYNRFDVVFEKGFGCRVYDVNGKEYIDFVSGVAVNCLGHCHPVIVNALKEQSQKLIHISNLYYNKPQIELAEKIISLSNHKSVFFCNSGTEATEAALKLARKYGKLKGGNSKNKIIYMKNSFHGRTLGALSVTGQLKYQMDFMPLIPEVIPVSFNDIDEIEKVMNENTCAVILEPIQGEGGIISANKDYLIKVRELCDKFDALLIFDEVQCGIGRTGKFFAYENFGVIPDVVCLAKGLGGGFPIGAIIANEKADVAFVKGDHGSTFGGNPLACAVSLSVLNELISSKIIENVNTLSKYLVDKLYNIKNKYGLIDEIKGIGLLLGISLKVDVKNFVNKCFENGLLLVSAGSNTVRLLPPLNISFDDIDCAIDIIEKTISSY